ncbi:MAG: acyl carrier protein phosphodiesterase [Flavobacteriaceae bacterium]|nr:acyl carrier protein phosphodiesterase [Flavobacteriaceae bacterium]
MNYLAHIYLSNNKELVQLGNFIADSVKGRSYLKYQEKIQTGIILHRRIDWFTDNNDIVKQSKRRLNSRYGLYKGIIIDIFYDHFLAKNWTKYSSTPLPNFTQSFYITLQDNFEILPERVKFMTPYIISNDWLLSYATLEGIEKVLIGMNKRTQDKSQMNLAINDLKENYSDFEKDFTLFFEKLRIFSTLKLKEIESDSNRLK